MAPKKAKGASSKAKAALEPLPLVNDKELEAAKQKLADKNKNNRLRSQMVYWLQQNKQHDAYKSAAPPVRKNYFDQWVAVQMAQGERASRHSKSTKKSKITELEDSWMAKEQMISVYGPNRTQALIESGTLEHRPCKKTGLDDEWNRQYKQENDKVIHRGDETTEKTMSAERTGMTDDAFKEMLDDLQTMATMDSDDVAKLEPFRVVKVEGAKPDAKSDSAASSNIAPPQPAETDSATFTALKNSPKTVVKNIQDALLELKEVWKETKDNRIAGVIHEDATKLLPKFAKIYKSCEAALIDKVDDEAVLLAFSKKVDELFSAYNDLIEWHHKLMPKESRKKKARIS